MESNGIGVVYEPETAKNSLKKHTNSLCLFATISRYSVYVMAFTKVTRPCCCLGSLETSFNQLSYPKVLFFSSHVEGNAPVELMLSLRPMEPLINLSRFEQWRKQRAEKRKEQK